jgi:histone acetyltransferase (RNA polymerase elongator complex component)
MPTPADVENICRQALAQHSDRHLELAFFGGSFTAIDRKTMCTLLKAAAHFCHAQGLHGIRISTRPDAINQEILEFLRYFKVTAVELGVQSMDDEVLQKNRRGHTAQDSIDAAALIKTNGFSLGLQMMIGLDGEKEDGALQTARRLCAMTPDTVRVYPVLVMKNTELEKRWREGKYHPFSLEKAVEKTACVIQLFQKAGVRIARVGLHADKSLETNLVAGPWHPAFRELCESTIMRNLLEEQLSGATSGKINVEIHPKDISRMMGHQGRTKQQLAEKGWEINLVLSNMAQRLEPKLLTTEALH